ncbi:MAG: sugar nucleotide-binding protein [Bacteriovoracaceae bacterium]|nr:sugar nucleotide-binding protein [Bacteriovoracaceae bacterium]
MRKTLLIFGASSFLGSNLIESLKNDYRIIGTYFETPLRIPGILTLRCDVLKKDTVNRLVAQFRPDVTIYAAGLSSITACHANPKLADALNSAGLINVCSSAERFGSKFVFISSSYVLGGEDIVYNESDTPFPGTSYGGSLASSEFYVQKSCLNYIIFRSCPLYGRAYHPTRKNWFEALEGVISQGLPANMDDHVLHGFLDVQLLAKIIKLAIEKNVTNRLFQVTSRDVLSRYEFSKLYCQIFKKDESLVARTQWPLPLDDSQFRSKALEKYHYKMNTTNAEEFFNLKFPSIEESLKATKKRLTG